MRVWLSGEPAKLLDRMDVTYVQTHVMAVMHKFLDAAFPNMTEPLVTYKTFWSTNTFFRGAYSYRRVVSDEMDVWARDLALPILNLATNKPVQIQIYYFYEC